MKFLVLFLFLLPNGKSTLAQPGFLQNLQESLKKSKEDTNKVNILAALADYYAFNQFDSSIHYAQQTFELSTLLKFDFGTYLGLRSLFFAYNCQGNYPKALKVTLQNQVIAERLRKKRPFTLTTVHYSLGLLNREMGNFPKSIQEFNEAIRINTAAGYPPQSMFAAHSQLGWVYKNLGQMDSALFFAKNGYDLGLKPSMFRRYFALSCAILGEIEELLGNSGKARNYFKEGILESTKFNNSYFLARNYNSLANLLYNNGQLDSSIFYAGNSLLVCQQHRFDEFGLHASTILTKNYEKLGQGDSTIKYMKIMSSTKDSVLGQSRVKEFQDFVFDEEQRRQEAQKKQDQRNNRIKTIGLLAGILALIFIAFMLWRNSLTKQKAKVRIEKAYDDLKSAQAQLIQSEKMASLGQLTAGIAHEIQNPLNFVNNFSEISNELLEEMKAALDQQNTDEANTIAIDVKMNLEKILHHGKRAEAIVKGMLEHSRTSSGQRELTDIHRLAEEYIRLAHHGIRAKRNSVTVKFETDFDQNAIKADIVKQDIGRVFLNLINNAIYAVSEKEKLNIPGYDPTVIFKTKQLGKMLEIRIRDNGMGIPAHIVDKIFQPFFTTKPTGIGTGLGLSLSYDIIKAHGGEFTVESKPGEFAEFIIRLP
jgi:two-component system, NtrC family, sensor kinase